ncbi:MAG: bifunctional homocysteine S-methyltransferase/methylenetetrahydrofolate reductase [Gemmatimonadetes bacterium]|nr:bifunctional homocysteine S-methyltransferase/methylenetetrahydrofolate reductase [Gemmatimonadota bacterium]
MNRFYELINDDLPHLWDGAMGTELYARGVFINRCYDELNLSNPDLVAAIHRDYARAGAEIVETNTFGANRVKLSSFGLDGRREEINRRGAEIAREAVGPDLLVAGAIGPLGVRVEPFGPTGLDEARTHFREQAAALAVAGADLIILETFSAVSEIEQAILGVREACDLPVVAQMTIDEGLCTAYGTEPEVFVPRLEAAGADVLGLNCSVGPHTMLEAVERILPLTKLKLSIQPNAGLPREVGDRQIYMASPEYMAKYAQRFIRLGVKFVGGCCGTTPEHIRRMAEVVYAAAPAASRPHSRVRVRAPAPVPPVADVKVVPLGERSGWGRKIARGELVTSVEIQPPKGTNSAGTLAAVRRLKDAGVDAVNILDGARAQLRMGALATAVLVEQTVGLEAVVHYTCRDRNLLGMVSDLLGAHALGLRNLLLVTGDPPKLGPYPDATAVFDIDSIGLTNLVRHLNHGLDPGGSALGALGEATSFVIGVAANPVAPDADHELRRFYWKVDAGAEFAVTQPIFDTERLLAFIAELKQREIWIPIVASIWPLASARNAEFLANEVPGIRVPEPIVERMRRAEERGEEHGVAEGVAIAREVWEAIRGEVQGIEVSAPFARTDLALRVLDGIAGVDAAGAAEESNDAETPAGFRPPREAARAPIG